MGEPEEDPLAQAERHVREGEERVARQAALLKQHYTPTGEKLLNELEKTLELAREHLRIEREARGIQ